MWFGGYEEERERGKKIAAVHNHNSTPCDTVFSNRKVVFFLYRGKNKRFVFRESPDLTRLKLGIVGNVAPRYTSDFFSFAFLAELDNC